MAEENKPTPQQSQDAVHLDSLTSLQQPPENEQIGGSNAAETRADGVVAPSNLGTPDGPSFYLPNTDLTNAPPVQSGDAQINNTDADSQETIRQDNASLEEGVAVDGILEVTASDQSDTPDSRSGNQEGDSAETIQSRQNSGTPDSEISPQIAPVQTQELQSNEVAELAAAIDDLAPVATPPVDLTNVPQVDIAETAVTATTVSNVSTLSSQSQTLLETNGPLTTSGTLVLTDADAVPAIVVAQTDTAGTYGQFRIGTDGAWTYTTNDAVNQLNAGQVVTETFNVATSDGGSATVTVNITGTNYVATLTSQSQSLTEGDAVLTTGGTLTLTDLDATDATVVAQTNTAGTYGKFSIGTDGTWTYTTNDALNTLNAGQIVTESFTVATSDGGSATVTVNITGTNDVATLTSQTQSLTEGDAVLTTGGTLTLTDLDATDATVVAQTDTVGTYGKFSIGTDGTWTYTTNDALNSLNADQVVTESFMVTTSDGGSATVTVNITGTNDVATLTSQTQSLTEGDAVLTTGGTLTLTDLDATDATVVAQTDTAGTYGKFSIGTDGVWTYTTNDAVNQLNAGQVVTETFNVATTDGGSATVIVNITGTNDVATLTSQSQSLTEGDAVLTTGGTLTLTDLDSTDATVVAQTNTAGTYGKFSINADGVWTYTTNDALNTLNAGQVVTESFTVATSDGGSATVTVNITGTNDVATLTSQSQSLTEGDAVLTTGGTLALTDLDATDATVVAQTNTAGTYGKFSIGTDGTWTYTTNDAANQLNAGQVVTETFSVATTDGGSATVAVNITGTNDVATLTSQTQSLTEGDAVLTTGGTLTLTDLDATDATVVAQTNTAGTYGKFSIGTDGTWTYTTNDALNTLNAGQVVTESFTVTTSDGGSATVTVNITGTNDVATLTSQSQSLTEGDAVLTTGGTLTLTDLDATDATVVAQTNTAGTYGKFSIGTDGVWTYTTNDTVNQLNAGQVVTETFNVATSDGGSATVTVNITGTNDVATLTSQSQSLTEGDAVLTTGGTLTLTDLDATDATVVAQTDTTGTYGKFSIGTDGTWIYTTNDALNTLNAGQVVTESFTVTTTDGGSATVTVNITGTNDVATLTSQTQSLTEGDAVLTTGGTLTLTDLDATDATVVAQTDTIGTHGKFSIDANGAWTYTTSDALNTLNAGQVVTESFTVATTDGGSATVTVNITGTNDVATLTSQTQSLTEGDAVLTTGGTLTLTDLDTTDATVVAQTNTAGTYGKFSIGTDGVWTYTTNDAVNQLNAGQVVTETFSVATTDGGSATVTVNITGTNDIATLSSQTQSLTEGDAVLTTGGMLTITDADATDVEATDATVVAQTNTVGTYGKFSIGTDGVWTYTTNDAVNQLNAGQVVTETFNVATSDGGSATVTVNITGTNDVATLTSQTQSLTEGDAVLTTGGTLTLTDLDATDATVVAQTNTAGTYGKFSIGTDGVWTYTTNDALNSLNAGQVVTESFTVATTDGGSATVTVNITGTNDVATLTSQTQSLTEGDAVLTTGGTLTLTDLDATDATVVAQTNTAGAYGKFSISADGTWTYTTNDAANQLNAGEVVTETFNVSTTDGGSATVTVNITGTNDVATLTSQSQSLTEGDAVLTTGGTLTLTDLDATDATVVAQTNTAGTYGKFSIGTDGTWTYTTNDALNTLNAGQVVTESFTVTTTDGGSATVTVNITGTNDVATLTSQTQSLTETNAVLTTGGTLTLADLDATDATVVAQTDTVGTYGKFSIGTDGTWTYTTNDALNTLNAGQVVTESFTVTTSDGGSATVTVSITGTNDVATLTSQTQSLTEGDAVLTTGGTLTLTDLDATDATVVAQTNTAGAYGKFSIGTDGTWTYTTNDAVNQLNAGQVVTETFNVATSDGGSATVTVNITGTNDVATLTSQTQSLTETNAVLTTGGTLTLADLDSTDATVVAQTDAAGTYGKFRIGTDGVWTYTTNDAANQLNAGQVVTETFNVSTTDGGSATVTVNITGTNDVATLTSQTQSLTEGDSVLTTGGTLTLTDLDATDATVVAQTNTAGTYGKFSIGTDGTWTYTTNDALNTLNPGQVVTESFTVATTDGGSATVTVNITGTNDVATLTSQSQSLTEGDAVLTTGGTLTLTDLDATDATVVAQTDTIGTHGKFSIDANGAWTYTTSDALNTLNAGQVVTESFTVTTSDGGSATVTVNITGTNDVATLTSQTQSLTEGDAVLTTGGTLTLTDLDATDATVVAQTDTAGTYGKFSIGTDGTWIYTTNDALNTLNAGQVVTESFTVTTTDGGSATVTVNITGTNDVATLTSQTQSLTEGDAVLTTGGTLTLTDLDVTDATVVAQTNTAGTYGKFSIGTDGTWSYTTNDALNTLNAGQVVTESFTVTTTDGGSATVTVNITGTNDVATLTSQTQSLTEGDAVLTTGGTLTLTDLDVTDATVVAQTNTAGTYGKFSIGTDGTWSYTTNDALNTLNAGQVVTESFTVTTTDGGSATVTVNITGTNDVATLTSQTQSLTEGDAVLTTAGTLALTDLDAADATVVAQTDAAGTYGKFSIGTDGVWTYTTNDAVNQLNAGQVVTETFNVSTTDGGSATVKVNITGTNDVATLTSQTQSLTEGDAVLTTGGTLTVTDADATDATVVAQTDTAGTYGKFSIGTDGTWTYTTNDALNTLNAGQVVTESFTVTTSDGGSATVTVNITGTNDVATLTSQTQSLTEGDAVLATGGTLTLTDLDATDATVVAQTNTVGTYGKFSIDANGTWTYTTNDALNSLNAGQVVTESFTVATTDGGSATVTVNITGTNDAAVISGTSSGNVTEAISGSAGTPTATGTLTSVDVDGTANAFTAVSTATSSTNGYGTYQVSEDGVWTYTLDNNNVTVNALFTGETLTDTFVVSSADGTTQTVTITINGSTDGLILGTANADTLVGTSGDDVIDGLAGGDTMTGGAGADIFVVSSGIAFAGQTNSGVVSGFDVVADFVSGTDQIKLPVNIVVAVDTSIVNGTNSTLRVGGNSVVRSHSISDGKVTFYSKDNGTNPISVDSASKLAAVVQYLSVNDLGDAGTTVSFGSQMETSNGSGLYKNYIYQQPGTEAGGGSATLVEIQVPTTSYTLNVVPNTQIINPIALDLNQDGVTYIDRSHGVTYDYGNDGSAVSTAWVESSDGLLAVQRDDGKLNVVFSTQEGETNLEGLAKVYDSNQDGVFDRQDEHFDQFGVWQDANSDGIVQEGEFKTLDEAGIESLSLESSGEQRLLENGDVIVYGQSTFTTKDGVTHILEDAGFATTQTQMLGMVSTTMPALIATVALTVEGQQSLYDYSVMATLETSDAKSGDEISLVINDGAITITHILTEEDVANSRYEFKLSDSAIVTDVTNVVGVHLGSSEASITTYANPVSVPYTLLEPSRYVNPDVDLNADSELAASSPQLEYSVIVSEVLESAASENQSLEGDAYVNSQAAESSDVMFLELGGVTYVIDTSETSSTNDANSDDYALTSSLSAPLVAGSWTEVVSDSSQATDPASSEEPAEPINPLTDTSAPPMINNNVLDDPRMTDQGSWTP